MTKYHFPNYYTEIPANIDNEIFNAICYIARKISELPAGEHTLELAAEQSNRPIMINRNAPIFGRVDISRFTIDYLEEQFSDYWMDMDQVEITFAWTYDGPFYQGKIWENEPELIIAEVYKFGDVQKDCKINAFVHKNLLYRTDMEDLKKKLFNAKMALDHPPEIRKNVPRELLGYRAMITNWPHEIICEIISEIGEEGIGKLGSLELDRMVKERARKIANMKQIEGGER